MTVQELAERLGEELPPMTRAELWWCAWLWLNWAYIEDLHAEWRRQLYARLRAAYDSPAHRRIEALALRETPFLRRVRLEAAHAG